MNFVDKSPKERGSLTLQNNDRVWEVTLETKPSGVGGGEGRLQIASHDRNV